MPVLNVLDEDTHIIVKFVDSQILDEAYARKLGMQLCQIAKDSDGKDLIVNFDKVKFIASSMIGQMVQLRNTCKKLGVKLKICCLRPEVAESISLMNLDKILNIFGCESTAKSG